MYVLISSRTFSGGEDFCYMHVVHVAGAGAVLGDDPERVALTPVADRDPAGLAGAVPPGFQDQQTSAKWALTVLDEHLTALAALPAGPDSP